MDNRPFLWMALFFIGYLLWVQWGAFKNPPTVRAPETTSNTHQIPTTAGDLPSASNLEPVAKETTNTTSTQAVNELPVISVKTDKLEVEISTRGGDILSVKLPTHTESLDDNTAITLLSSAYPAYIAQSGLLHDNVAGLDTSMLAPNHYAQFAATQTNYNLAEGAGRLEVPLTWQSETGVTVEKVYIFESGKFSVEVEHRVKNNSGQIWTGRQYRQLRHGEVTKQTGMLGSRAYQGTAYFNEKYEKITYKKISKEKLIEVPATNTFVSIVQHYFISAWVPEPKSSAEQVYAKSIANAAGGEEYLIGLNSAPQSIANGASGTFKSVFYAGPKSPDVLYSLAPGLELTSDYGIFTVFAKPIFWVLRWIQANIASNWGWAIILLTLLIKLMFYPLSAKSYKSMAKMRTVAPKLADLKDRFGDDKVKYQQAMMNLYKKEQINPLSGCLPILIQIPIFISLYWVLLEAVELRQAPWIGWIKDLSIRDPFFILPVLMGATMWFQQKLNPPQPDPMMQKVLTWMPIVFTVFFLFFPAGLVLYWVVNSVLSIAQQWFITRQIENTAGRA